MRTFVPVVAIARILRRTFTGKVIISAPHGVVGIRVGVEQRGVVD